MQVSICTVIVYRQDWLCKFKRGTELIWKTKRVDSVTSDRESNAFKLTDEHVHVSAGLTRNAAAAPARAAAPDPLLGIRLAYSCPGQAEN